MNKQEIFNKIVSHARKQKAISMYNEYSGECAYHGQDGLKCFLGVLISDEMYDKRMEEHSVGWIVDEFPEMKQIFSVDDLQGHEELSFFNDIQYIHDNYPHKYWEDNFEEFAIRYDVDYTLEKPE